MEAAEANFDFLLTEVEEADDKDLLLKKQKKILLDRYEVDMNKFVNCAVFEGEIGIYEDKKYYLLVI